jgi:Na+-translocating ferredoxin:NAD+ oxidoreductase RnfA subunit
MSNVPLAIFIIISVFTMNLTLQCALGIKGTADYKKNTHLATLIKLSIIFFSVAMLWFFFTKIVFLFFSGIFIYIIMFPVSCMVYDILEYSVFVFLLSKNINYGECFISFPAGITAAVVFICVNIADTFLQALVISLGFITGILLVIIIITEVQKRASLESIPRFLVGKPLTFITMSFLSLIFSAASILILNIVAIK